MNNEDQHNQGGAVSKSLKKLNNVLLYIIVSIFIGNLFVGAIFNSTPMAKADPPGIDVTFPAPGTVEANMALWIDEGNIEKDCPGNNCVINMGVAVKSPAQYTANLGVGYAPKFVKLIRKLAGEQEKEVVSVDISDIENNPEQSKVVQLKDSTAVKGKTYEYYPVHVYQKGRNPFVPGDRGGTVYMGPVNGKRTQITAEPDAEIKEFKITKLTNLGCSEEARHDNDLFCDIKVDFSTEDLPFGVVKYEFKVVGGAFKFHGSEYSEPGGSDTFVLNNEEFRNKSVKIGLEEGLSYYQLSLKQEYRPPGPGVIIPTITYTPIVPYIAKKDMVGQSETPEEAVARVGQPIENDPRNPVDANADCKLALFGGDAPFWNPSSWFQDAICEIMNLVSTVLVGILNWSLDLLKQVSIVPSLDNKYFLATSNFNLFFTEKAYAAIGPSLQANTGKAYIITSWKWMLGLVNIVIIIALLIIAFSNILRINIDTYIIKKSLPGLVLGVLLANFSLLIARMIVEFSDLLVYTLGSNIQLDPNSDLYRAIGIKGLAGGTAVTIAGLVSIIGGLAILGPVGGVAGGCLALLIALLPTVATTLLALMLYVRVAVIYFLVIISPLAFIMLALPNTSVYFKKWWSLFITWVLLAPAVWFILWIIAKIGGAGGGNTATGFLISIALLYFALILPFKWGGAIMATWAKIGKVLSRAPAKGVGAVGGMMSRGEGWVKPVGKFLNKASMAMDIPLAWSTTKKAWSTLEEDRVAVAQREAVGSIGFRRINPDATRTSIFRRMGDFEKFDTDTLVNFAGIEVDNNGNVVSNKYDSLDKMGNIKSGDEFHKVVGATGAMLKKLRYLRSTPAYARGDRDTIAEAQLLYNALTSGSLPLAGLAEKGNTTGWGTIMPVGPAPRGGWDLTPAALNASIFTPTISSNPAAPLQRLDPETGQMVRYGQYDNDPNSDTYGEMQIDFNASKKAWGQVAPELGEADAHKVTGFVHAHEAFHDIAANKLSPEQQAMLKMKDTSGQVMEEKLADAYARQALNLGDEETKARDRKALDDFKAQMPEDSRGLMDLKYEGEGDNNLLLGLHRAGLEYGKISNTRLSETPTHAGLGLDRPAPAAGSAPALTKEEQEEEVRKNAYIGGVREEYHRETEKIIEKAPEDAAGSKLLDGDQTLRVARLITGRLTVRPNEEQRYNHALYESSLQGAKGAEQKLRVALEQPAVGASKAKVEGIVQTVRTTLPAQLSQKLQTEYQITPEIQARLKPDIQGFTDAVNFKNVVSHRIANEALDITQPMRANLTARLQKGDIDWTGLDRIQSELKTQEQKLSIGRVAPVELDAAYKTLVRIHPSAQIQVEGAKSQPEILSKIKQSRAAIGQLSTPEIRRAMESGGSTQQVEAKIRQNYQAKFEVQHNLDQINKAMSDAVRSVRISRPNLTNEQVSMDLERRVTENVRIKDLIERVTKVDPVYKETVVSGVARKIAPQYAKNPSYKIDAGAISQISNQELRRVASAPRPAPRVSIARPASRPIAKPMNDIRPIPEKPSPSQWETQKVESIIATRK